MSQNSTPPVTARDALVCLKKQDYAAVLGWIDKQEGGFPSDFVEQVCESGVVVLVHRLFQRHTGEMKETYLRAAARVGSIGTLKLLLPRGTNTMAGRAMATAVEHGQMGCVKFLLGSGVEADNTLLVLAAKHNKLPLVRFLLEHCDPTHRFSEALCVACARDNRRVVDLLLPVSNVEEAGMELEKKMPLERHRTACAKEVIALAQSLRQRTRLMEHLEVPSTAAKKKM